MLRRILGDDFAEYGGAVNAMALTPALILMGLIAFMAFSYIESFRRADFSYSMVAYGAVSLYSLAIVVYTCYYFINFANDTFKHFLYRIYETGVLFAIVASLPMFVVSFAMAFSNIWLVRHEGFRPVNLLGIFLGIFTFIGTLFVYEGRYLFYGTNAVVYKIYDTLYFMLSYTVSFMECLFLFIMLTAFHLCGKIQICSYNHRTGKPILFDMKQAKIHGNIKGICG